MSSPVTPSCCCTTDTFKTLLDAVQALLQKIQDFEADMEKEELSASEDDDDEKTVPPYKRPLWKARRY